MDVGKERGIRMFRIRPTFISVETLHRGRGISVPTKRERHNRFHRLHFWFVGVKVRVTKFLAANR